MPKVTLEYTLPAEGEDFETAKNAQKWKCVVLDLHRELRSIIKYECDKSEDYIEAAERLKRKLFDCLEEEGLDLWT